MDDCREDVGNMTILGPGMFDMVTAGVVTVSGEVIDDSGVGARTYIARLRLLSTGTTDKRENTTTTQIDASTDWIIPNGAAPDDYEVRYVSHTGQALNGSTNLTENNWAALTSNAIMTLTKALAGAESQSCSFTVEVRKGSSGGALDSASYTLSIDRAV